jgi:DNA ligase-1
MKEADTFYKEALKAGHEGLIVKNLEAKYQSGRRVSGGWLKVKPVMESLDLVITGATWGTGKRVGWLGSYILSCRDPDTGKFLECGMLGTGVKEKKTNAEDVTLQDMTKLLKPYIEFEKGNEVKIKPKVVIEVACEEIQKSPTYSSGYALRFPRFIRIRIDKGADEADTTQRIDALFEMQKGNKPLKN